MIVNCICLLVKNPNKINKSYALIYQVKMMSNNSRLINLNLFYQIIMEVEKNYIKWIQISIHIWTWVANLSNLRIPLRL